MVCIGGSYLLFYAFGLIRNCYATTGQGEYFVMQYLLAQPLTYLTGKSLRYSSDIEKEVKYY